MKKIALIAFLFGSQLIITNPSQAARLENRIEVREDGRAPKKLTRKEEKRAAFQQALQQAATLQEQAPNYGRELFLGSPIWLICGIVLAVIGLIMVAFGSIISIVGGSILGLGFLIILSFIIYRAVMGTL